MKAGHTQRKIAELIDRSPPTICREKSRNTKLKG
ncbi:MAG TPA: hypothetical protein DCZ03_00405 [Gammaproteobacteria bacterium]|nr:hypothetical protein [Gammaproteobacteria bacterium]